MRRSSTAAAAAVTSASAQSRKPARRSVAASEPPLADAVESSAPMFDLARVPLPGRESEFEAVVSFVQSRLSPEHGHGHALFVFGACGCGKTSTVLRAMRSFHNRPLPCDRQVRERGLDDEGTAAGGGGRESGGGRGGKRARTASAHRGTPSQTQRGKVAKRDQHCSPDIGSSGRPSSSSSAAGGSGSASDSPHSAGHQSSRTSTDLSDTASLAKNLFHTGDDNGDTADMSYYHARYPALYAAVVSGSSSSAKAPAQAHYVNCADLSPEQLAASIHDSMKAAYPRPSALVSALMADIRSLPERGKKERRAVGGLHEGSSVAAGDVLSGHGRCKRQQPPSAMPLQVVVLDEVEYVRPATRALLTELAAMSFHPASRLALVCISNHRDLVHVPQTLMEELSFAPYSVQQLKQIGMAIAQEEIARRFSAPPPRPCERADRTGGGRGRQRKCAVGGVEATTTTTTTAAAASAASVTISPSLYEYVARKALMEYSGDVRQVAAMCRRVVYTACEEWKAKCEAAGDRRWQGGDSVEQQEKLEAAVDSYCHTMKHADGVGGGGGGAAAAAAGGGRSGPSSSTEQGLSASERGGRCAVTLANSMKVIRGAAVEDHLQQHIAHMPEQSLYLLSCLITVTRKHERDRRSAATAIGGRRTTITTNNSNSSIRSAGYGRGHAGGGGVVANSTAMTQREVHGLYMQLMSRHHFPPMNGSGVATTLSFLADLAIITRPQQRGNEEVFSFSGSCSLDALEMAVIERGEQQRREMLDAGLDGSENRLAAVLQELKTLTGLTF